MRALILAAGVGSRMRPLTDKIHKCCLSVAGKPLLTGQVDILCSCGITDIVVITGYRRQEVMALGADRAEYLFNPFFKSTNSITSLWLAQRFFSDDILILNCDVIFDASLVEQLVVSPHQISVAVCSDWSDDRGYKAEINSKGNVLRMGKHLDRPSAEYAGITFLRETILPETVKTMENFFNKDQFDVWYEDAISAMLESGIVGNAVFASPDKWYELDTADEYMIANKRIKDW